MLVSLHHAQELIWKEKSKNWAKQYKNGIAATDRRPCRRNYSKTTAKLSYI
jgi:hypothetical protein